MCKSKCTSLKKTKTKQTKIPNLVKPSQTRTDHWKRFYNIGGRKKPAFHPVVLVL